MVQILSGLISYLLLAIYCQEEHGEKVNIARVRELGTKIQNESRQPGPTISDDMPCGSEFTVDPEIP